MKNKKKVITLVTVLASTALVIGTVAVASSYAEKETNIAFSDGNYSMTLNGSNGAASLSTKKTSNVVAKTAENNDVSFDYKNNQAVSGKVAKVLAGGSYANHDPIHNMASITVVSDAATNDAKLYYGKTSSYMPDFVDLAQAATPVTGISGANFFKIVATNEVEIESIVINFGCETKDYGDIALNGSDEPLANAYSFKFVTDHYEMVRGSAYASAKTVFVPDYYDDGEHGQAPVTALAANSGYGTFEGSSNVAKVYLPETIQSFGQYCFYSANPITEITLPRDLVSTNSHPLPKSSLQILNIHSRNLSTVTTTYIGSTYTPNLHTINVSADVERLPSLVNSWSGISPTIYYEGTEAEWATVLAASAGIWEEAPGDVICSDTVIADITLHFEGATLGGDSDSKVISKAVGKTIADFGSPLYNGGTKKFVGWFDAAEGGNKIVFPYSVTADADIYAHFEDYGAGISFANPIDVTVGQSYNYSTDEVKSVGYFRYTASAAEVVTFTVTSAASAFGDYVYFHVYDSTEAAVSIETGNSAATDVKKVSMPSSYGKNIPLKIRLAADESVFVTVDGGNSSRVGDFTLAVNTVVAGQDYTTANVYSYGNAVANPPRYGVEWYSFTPSVTKAYLYTATATAWCGGSFGHFEAGVWTSDASSSSQYNVSAGNTIKVLKELTAGVTYYYGFTTNTAGAQLTFSVTDELDPGMAKSSAILMTVDGSAETVGYDSNFPTVWYKFAVSAGGKVRLVISSGTIYTSGSSRPLFAVEDADGAALTLEAGRTAQDKVLDLASAGTYYVAITTSSSAKNFDFEIQSVGVEYTINVYALGPSGGITSTETVDENTPYVLADPVFKSNGHTYYTGFDGWYTDSAFTQPFTSGDLITGNTNIYAKLDGKYLSDLFNTIDAMYPGMFDDILAGTYHWILDGYNIVSTNEGVSSSYSEMSLVAKKNINVSFDYTVSSEKGWDKFFVYTRPAIGGTRTTIVNGASGNDPVATGSVSTPLSAGNVIELVYQKDSGGNVGADKVTLSNFAVLDAATVQLTYDFQDGVTANQVVDVISGAAITKIADPTRSGYRFDGWYTEPLGAGSEFNFANGISANTTIYAKWVEQVTLAIHENGPYTSATEVHLLDKGSSYTLPDLNNSYYTGFEGWFSDEDLTDSLGLNPTITVNSDMSAFAKHSYNYRMDAFNSIDMAYPGIFSNIDGNMDACHWDFAYYPASGYTFTSSGADGKTSLITLTLAVSTVVSFDWSISSESGYDIGYIYYYVADTKTNIADNISGEQTNSFSATLPAGAEITFRYTKDNSMRSGEDCLKIFNATFVAA